MIFIKDPEANNIITVYSSDKKWYLRFVRMHAKWYPSPALWVVKNDNSNKSIDKESILDIDKVPLELLKNMFEVALEQKVEDFNKIL